MDLIQQFDYYHNHLDNAVQEVAASECKLSLALQHAIWDDDTKEALSTLQVHVLNLRKSIKLGAQYRENLVNQAFVNSAEYQNQLHLD